MRRRLNVEIQKGFLLPNFQHAATSRPRPNTENVFAIADAEHSAANILTSITKLIADKREQQVLPVAVSHALLHPHNPLSAFSIHLVLPDGSNILLE